MDKLTPKQIVEHFNLLPDQQQIETLKLLAQQLNAIEIVLMLAELPVEEQKSFAEGVTAKLGSLASQLDQAENRVQLQAAFEGGAGSDIPPEQILEDLHDLAKAELGRSPSASDPVPTDDIFPPSGDVDWQAYRDQHAEELRALIEAKLAGQPAEPDEPARDLIPLLDALKKSVAQVGNNNEARPVPAPSAARTARKPRKRRA